MFVLTQQTEINLFCEYVRIVNLRKVWDTFIKNTQLQKVMTRKVDFCLCKLGKQEGSFLQARYKSTWEGSTRVLSQFVLSISKILKSRTDHWIDLFYGRYFCNRFRSYYAWIRKRIEAEQRC